MGDGINDAPALHAADVGISVDHAVDVAKDAADFVLLKHDLAILREGIDEGRRTFANTLKYILTTISANFGNMFSMAGASMFLPFLPLLAPQILLNNFLSDIPAITIARDNVDPEMVAKPRRWNTKFIRNYMVLFGLVSSVFDFLTFATLLYVFNASPEEFRTGWFIESLLTELVIALVVRTRHLFFRSRPGKLLLRTTLLFIAIALAMPYLPFVVGVRIRTAAGAADARDGRAHCVVRRRHGGGEEIFLCTDTERECLIERICIRGHRRRRPLVVAGERASAYALPVTAK